MKLTFETLINKNRDLVWDCFDIPDNLPKWQSNLKSFQRKTGEPGQVGAVSDLIYEEDGKEITMTETITVRNIPDELEAIYETEGIRYITKNKFVKVDENTTNWIIESNVEFSGKLKLFSSLISKYLKKRMNENVQGFKQLVETS
jgi:hypothetical protein